MLLSNENESCRELKSEYHLPSIYSGTKDVIKNLTAGIAITSTVPIDDRKIYSHIPLNNITPYFV